MRMKMTVAIILIIILIIILLAVGTVVPVYFVVSKFVVASSFSDRVVTVIHKGERYHVVPESTLDDVLVLIDLEGKRHYVLSEEKLRLLGPKLLGEGD